jgi:hypothetical protein
MSKYHELSITKRYASISDVVGSLLYQYINWESKWYNPKQIPVGSLVKSNWKARITFEGSSVVDLINEPLIVVKTYSDCAELSNGDSFNFYWLKRVA